MALGPLVHIDIEGVPMPFAQLSSTIQNIMQIFTALNALMSGSSGN